MATGDLTQKEVAIKYQIPVRTLRNKKAKRHMLSHGRQTALSSAEEEDIVKHVLACASFGLPLDSKDLRYLVKSYLDNSKKTVTQFKNNMPGNDWVEKFDKRHDAITLRKCQNIKRTRAEVSPDEMKTFYENLQKTLKDVPPQNILNYDETNFSDNVGSKKCIFRRGVKYPERVINFSKGNITTMYAGSASGEVLPPYVVYKSVHLWKSWCSGGPRGTRYARTKSGWMDMVCFEEWFQSMVIPWARKLQGTKVLIGDNLSSHISAKVLQLCQQHDIKFVLLVPNSTDKCQPLDVAFFAPLKREWRKILEEYKMLNRNSTSLEKDQFPALLDKLMTNIGLRNEANIKAGFRACGISPFNPNKVISKLPPAKGDAAASTSFQRSFMISESLLQYLQQFKYKPRENEKKQQRKKLDVAPGKSVSLEEIESMNSQTQKKKTAKSTTEIDASSEDNNASHFHSDEDTNDEDTNDEDTNDEDTSDEDTSDRDTSDEDGDTGMTAEEKMLNMPSIEEKAKVNDFVVIKLTCDDSLTTKLYVAKVLEVIGSVYSVTYLRQSKKVLNAFIFPKIQDGPWNIDHENIVSILDLVQKKGATKRQSSFMVFDCDLSFCQ